ncbi:hypothetical protein B0G38_000874 [Arthrobacter sp. VKM Ac-2550]|nr:hypothetical protein [Arthrobacter sp. VKM Ac-2550]
MKDLISAARNAGRSDASLTLWLNTPTGYLDGARPVDLFEEATESVVEAVRQSFTVEW